jgi:hypothetical protein
MLAMEPAASTREVCVVPQTERLRALQPQLREQQVRLRAM